MLPSATEIVCALGLTDHLVGISHDCDYPPEIQTKPVLSEAIVTTALPSGEINARIGAQLHNGLSVYHLDSAQLATLQPDLILTQELCEVCAPSYDLVQQAAKLVAGEPKIVSLEPHGLADILDNILLVGELTGTVPRAQTVVAGLQDRIDRVRSATGGAARPRVACLEWLDPLFVGGHWVPEMVTIAGGHDALGHAGEPSFVIAWEAVAAAQPDVIIVMPCGFDVSRIRLEMSLLTSRPGWETLRAVRANAVYLTDASSYFSRPGPRIVDGVEILASILHPERWSCTLRPDAFERTSPADLIAATRTD